MYLDFLYPNDKQFLISSTRICSHNTYSINPQLFINRVTEILSPHWNNWLLCQTCSVFYFDADAKVRFTAREKQFNNFSLFKIVFYPEYVIFPTEVPLTRNTIIPHYYQMYCMDISVSENVIISFICCVTSRIFRYSEALCAISICDIAERPNL